MSSATSLHQQLISAGIIPDPDRVSPETIEMIRQHNKRRYEEQRWRNDPLELMFRFDLSWDSWRHGWANNITEIAERLADLADLIRPKY